MKKNIHTFFIKKISLHSPKARMILPPTTFYLWDEGAKYVL